MHFKVGYQFQDYKLKEKSCQEIFKKKITLKVNVTCCSALVPSCAQTSQCNGDVQVGKRICPPTPLVALRIETWHT